MRTIAIVITVIALLVGAAICHHNAPVAGPGGFAVEDQGADWATILSIVAGALTALEVAIRTILQLIAKRKPTEAQDAAKTDPATPKPPDG